MASEKKSDQLGMNYSTASGRLVKDILWSFIEASGRDLCHVCGKKMERTTFSIEHIIPWQDSANPVGMFFDVKNISFSHLSCNIAGARRSSSPHGTERRYKKHGCRCDLCKDAVKIAMAAYRKKQSDVAEFQQLPLGKTNNEP